MPGNAILRFYAELNDFLPHERRFATFAYPLSLTASVKDVIEAVGVPHPEVGLVLVDGVPADFSHLLRGGERLSVYPEFKILDVTAVAPLRPPLRKLQFVLDGHLGKLATYLRMLGVDSSYRTDWDDRELARISSDEERILLSRDVGLLKRSAVVFGYFVRSTEPRRQLVEVVRRFNLSAAASPFSRCLACNALLHPVPKQSVIERLDPKTREFYDEFQICPACNRLYWAGSHYAHMQEFLQRVLAECSR